MEVLRVEAEMGGARNPESPMSDVIFVAAGLAVFTAMSLYVYACDRL
jgi:hypothetical protein